LLESKSLKYIIKNSYKGLVIIYINKVLKSNKFLLFILVIINLIDFDNNK
jgi:hypothetical protein